METDKLIHSRIKGIYHLLQAHTFKMLIWGGIEADSKLKGCPGLSQVEKKESAPQLSKSPRHRDTQGHRDVSARERALGLEE